MLLNESTHRQVCEDRHRLPVEQTTCLLSASAALGVLPQKVFILEKSYLSYYEVTCQKAHTQHAAYYQIRQNTWQLCVQLLDPLKDVSPLLGQFHKPAMSRSDLKMQISLL